MSETTAKTNVPSLKDLLARLRDINGVLESSEHRLDFLASNSPQDKSEDSSPVSEASATMDDLNNVIDRISRRANHIGKSTNIIVGS